MWEIKVAYWPCACMYKGRKPLCPLLPSCYSKMTPKKETRQTKKMCRIGWLRPTAGFRRRAFNGPGRGRTICVLCDKCAVRVSCCLPAEGDKRSAGAVVRVDRDRRREGKGYGGGMGGGERNVGWQAASDQNIKVGAVTRPCAQECGWVGGWVGG